MIVCGAFGQISCIVHLFFNMKCFQWDIATSIALYTMHLSSFCRNTRMYLYILGIFYLVNSTHKENYSENGSNYMLVVYMLYVIYRCE